MTNRIFRSICLVATAVLLAALALIMTVLYGYFSDVQKEQLAAETRLAAQGVEQNGLAFFDNLNAGDTRITWIAADGEVLYDNKTDETAMETHAEREEIMEALDIGYGESTRYSTTLTRRQMYTAIRLTDGSVIRLSIAQNTFLTLTLGMLQPMALILLATVILALLLASRLSKRIVEPLNQLNLDEPLSNEGYDEIAPLLRRIDAQQKEIRAQRDELKQRRREFNAVTDGMHEGLVLLGARGNILSINRAAQSLLGADSDCVGKHIYVICRAPALQALISDASAGDRGDRVIAMAGREFSFSISPVLVHGEVVGMVLLIVDVTENVDAEKMRREFTANVSHELKTPLQTISGCAELLANGMVKAEDTPQFAGQIYKEAQRMTALIEDIIRLSHLDEGAEDMNREKLDLYTMAVSAVQSLQSEAESANVQLSLSGESTMIYGIPQLVSVLINNLCDNAIKYNREGGSVSVTVRTEGDAAVLSVADTGIGIPTEDQDRIFERFYRVDKSRSKKVGGTGLGLSIVKHAAKLHGARISLRSTVGEGTTITVRFPAAN